MVKLVTNSLRPLFSSTDDRNDYDVTLRGSDGVTVHAHRFILRRRSEYFDGMFRSGLLDGDPVFHQFSGAVLEMIVQFLYEGRVQVAEDQLFALIDAADYFRIKRLVDLCEIRVCRSLDSPFNDDGRDCGQEGVSLESIVEYFVLGCRLSRYRLKAYSLEALMPRLHEFGVLSALTNDFAEYRFVEELCRLHGIDVEARMKRERSFFVEEFWTLLVHRFCFIDSRLRIALSSESNLKGVAAYQFCQNLISARKRISSGFVEFSKLPKRSRWCLFDPESRKIIQVTKDSEWSAVVRFKALETNDDDDDSIRVVHEFSVSFPQHTSREDVLWVSLYGDFAFIVAKPFHLIVFSLLRDHVIGCFSFRRFTVVSATLTFQGGLATLVSTVVNHESEFRSVSHLDVSDPRCVLHLSSYLCKDDEKVFTLDFFDRLFLKDGSIFASFGGTHPTKLNGFGADAGDLRIVGLRLRVAYVWRETHLDVVAVDCLGTRKGRVSLPYSPRPFFITSGNLLLGFSDSTSGFVVDLKRHLQWSRTAEEAERLLASSSHLGSDWSNAMMTIGSEFVVNSLWFYGDQFVVDKNKAAPFYRCFVGRTLN